MRRRLLIILGLVVLAVLSLSLPACEQAPVSTPTPTPSQNATSSPINPNWTSPPQVQEPALPDTADVVAQVKPSVVAINVELLTYDIFNQPTKVKGAGSGWIIDEDGYIVTNNHVVEGAQNIAVTLADDRTFPADTVGTDSLTDLAVVKINAQNLPAANIGDSSGLRVGDWLVAIGNSLGMGISATGGIVSALGVSLTVSSGQTLHDLVQTDAAINPGNSGGPLVNMAGEVIGINSIKIAQVGVEGMGYAISIDEAMPIIEELIKAGYVVRPWLGIGTFTVSEVVASWYNLAVDKGVLVTEVATDSPADKAGLKAGDVITIIEGKEISDASELRQVIDSCEIGQRVEITFWRAKTENTTYATLAESPPPS
jgi:serine protease Do